MCFCLVLNRVRKGKCVGDREMVAWKSNLGNSMSDSHFPVPGDSENTGRSRECMIFYGHTVLFNWLFWLPPMAIKGWDLIFYEVSPSYLFQVNLCYLCQACTSLLHSRKMLQHYLQVRWILNQVRSVVHLCSLLNGKYYSIFRLSFQQ